MPQGLQIWDAAGNLTFDTTHSIPKIFGTTSIGGAATGSVSDARYSVIAAGTGSLLYMLIPTDGTGRLYESPSIGFSGTTITWSWPTANRWPLTLVYGIY